MSVGSIAVLCDACSVLIIINMANVRVFQVENYACYSDHGNVNLKFFVSCCLCHVE